MPKYWCVNFELDENMKHGIDENLWMMGYQYAADQNDTPPRKAAITRNWRKLEEIGAGDRFVAYLPRNKFFATGTVRKPRRAQTSRDPTDTIKRYLERGKAYENGFVYFDSSVVYENFTDACDEYPVRIDVEGWENHVPDGVSVTGLDLPRYKTVNAVFGIDKSEFDRIAKQLAPASRRDPKKQVTGDGEAAADESVVEALEKSYAKSQGFLLHSKLRKALEDHAMDAAKQHFESLGYVVEDHHKDHPYDLRCTKKKKLLYVEVKGTQSGGDGIILTYGEVEFSRRHTRQMALFVLHSIKVSPDGMALSNGEKNVILPWDVDQGYLKPISFVYEVPGKVGDS